MKDYPPIKGTDLPTNVPPSIEQIKTDTKNETLRGVLELLEKEEVNKYNEYMVARLKAEVKNL